MNRSKAIGTAAETAVVLHFRGNGFPHAERRALAGSADLGDILIPGLVVEVKGGKAAETAGDGQIRTWQNETDVERANAKADIGLLVTKRAGYGATRTGEWHCYVRLSHLVALRGGEYGQDELDVWCRMQLREAVWLLRQGGYGTPWGAS